MAVPTEPPLLIYMLVWDANLLLWVPAEQP